MTVEEILEYYYERSHQYSFIEDDPISIPHMFSKKQDIEIMGLFASILAWGQRKTTINNCKKLVELMDSSPHDFVLNHQEKDLKRMEGFVHRTFNSTDLLGLVAFFRNYYQENDSLESVFSSPISDPSDHVGAGILNFHQEVMSQDTTANRTKKHIAKPFGSSTCKRLNMYLRWMVRKDERGVDFGIWEKILPSQLLCPLDVHVERNARRLGLIERKQTDWRTAVELTNALKEIDAEDPVRFDYVLFGMGIIEKNEPLIF
ncbi:MAG TPA: TIGR02757 family protein [Chitinophagales bacterium]|nr:TIGR02757 family protein [Chitinophagales bacterium]